MREYGFSKVLFLLCPENWKKPLGNDWEDVLSIIIRKWSPESYLGKGQSLKKEEDFQHQFAAQMGSLSRKINKEYGVSISDLELLKTTYLVYLEKEIVVTKRNKEQQNLLDKIGVNLDLC